MKVENQTYDYERALYGIHQAEVCNCAFDGPADGESALKETADLLVDHCFFNLRYPLWHTTNTVLSHSTLTEKCRAAMWYDQNITVDNCQMDGIKALRECRHVVLKNCKIHSPEFAWRCGDLSVDLCELNSEYPFFECRDLQIHQLTMHGKYAFQYVEKASIFHSELDTKDAFWHSKDVTVTDSLIRGEYLGWYSENLKLIRCHIIGTQPLCYCKGLVLENCTMDNADLAFENSQVTATIVGGIDSVKNPRCGEIHADSIGQIILEPDRIDPSKTKIVCR